MLSRMWMICFLALTLSACGASPDLASPLSSDAPGYDLSSENFPAIPDEELASMAATAPFAKSNHERLAWEDARFPGRQNWSDYLISILKTDWSSLLKGAQDIQSFCPSYHRLNRDQQANVWAQLIVAMTKYESSFNPLTRFHEKSMGIDPITHAPVYSEGLLQLSYQDTQGHRHCQFDWSRDRQLAAKDPRKTILNPYTNLYCGVGILAKQVQRTGRIMVGSGAYWAILKTNSRYQKIHQIQSLVKGLNLCR